MQKNMTRKFPKFSITIPERYLKRIEVERGLIPRSRFITEILKRQFTAEDNEEIKRENDQ